MPVQKSFSTISPAPPNYPTVARLSQIDRWESAVRIGLPPLRRVLPPLESSIGLAPNNLLVIPIHLSVKPRTCLL